jgi:hypothetical protein
MSLTVEIEHAVIIIMLTVVLLSFVMLSAIMLNVGSLRWVCCTSKSDLSSATKGDPNHTSDNYEFGHN